MLCMHSREGVHVVQLCVFLLCIQHLRLGLFMYCFTRVSSLPSLCLRLRLDRMYVTVILVTNTYTIYNYVNSLKYLN